MSTLPQFLLDICPAPDLYVVVTFLPESKKFKQKVNPIIAENALKWLLSRLNKKIFGHGFKRKGFRCGVVTSLEKQATNIHANLAIQFPSDKNTAEIADEIINLIRNGYWFGREYAIQECWDPFGLMDYISKEGQDSIVLSCTYKALH